VIWEYWRERGEREYMMEPRRSGKGKQFKIVSYYDNKTLE